MSKISLLLGVHAHQPVGNFSTVIEEAHLKCYRPFLQLLSRYPAFHFSVHFSGWLLDQLCDRYPEDMQLLGVMVARGQVELFGAGDYEPVLASIPHRDRLVQLETMSAKLEQRFGVRPEGAWLTERVWESNIVPSLVASGIRYVAVDDYHFLASGRQDAELDSFFSTEEDGQRLDLFPISEPLRYRFPFAPAHEAVGYLESLADAGKAAAIYFDDIEKFGIWPETFEWVYNQGWLERFIQGVLGSPKIRTETYRTYHARERPRGIVYLPTASYIEMNEWTLGAGVAEHYSDLVRRERDADRYGATKAFVRGGIWRNFFSRYPESNWMHKRMLALSSRLASMRSSPAVRAVAPLLYRAQANDAYWHGLFGGLYLPHLRRTIWQSLVALERALDAIEPRTFPIRGDLDLDGVEEIFIGDAQLQIVSRADGLGAIVELDSYVLGHNFGDSLRRIAEPYYAQLFAAPAGHEGSGIASAHDRVELKHPISAADTTPDRHPRALFIDAVRDASGTANVLDDYALVACSPNEARWQSRTRGLVEKSLRIDQGELIVDYRFDPACAGVFTTTINVAMPSADGFSGRYILEDGSIPCGFGQTLALDEMRIVTLDDRELGGGIAIHATPAVRLAAGPHHAVSRSEGGFEKIMQAACVVLEWPLDAAHRAVSVRLNIKI